MALDIKKSLAKYLLFYPFLKLIWLIDFFLGLILPHKYDDPSWPDKDAVLTELSDRSDPSSPYRSTMSPQRLRLNDDDTNIYKEFKATAEKFYDSKTLGVREILSIDDELQPNGKVFKKFSLGKYKWTSYDEILNRVNNLSDGLLELGLKSDDNVVLFSETKPEWLMSALACFRIKVPIVTLYATLGVDALSFGINQTQTKFLITNADQLGKIEKILNKIPRVTHLIVFTDKYNKNSFIEFKNKVNQIKTFSMDEVELIGKNSEKKEFQSPKSDDLAVIMYTSGSTGNPKGVMISHRNLLTSLKALIDRLVKSNRHKETYIAFLPQAHVLELCSELACLLNGVKIGYSSPQTIADNSTAVKKGQKGDLRVLKPTVITLVPTVLERLAKAVNEKISKTNCFFKLFFDLAYTQKLECFRAKRQTRLLDRLLFKRISRSVVGGRLKLMLSAGALLNKEVHEFAQVCLSAVMQAYGLTETCGAAVTQLPNQTDVGVVGSVVPCCEIRLVDWDEGNYRSSDKPNPRGEIYVGGDNVALGYYEMPEKTKEDFKEIDGVRYFATGDIGEMLEGGTLKIIDRKKDLVKLQGGEYVSLNKVESVIKLLPFVDNCCVVADPSKNNCICLICPNVKTVIELMKQNATVNAGDLESLNEISDSNQKAKELAVVLEKNKKFVDTLSKETISFCLKQGLERFEIPTGYKFVGEIWLPDTGLVTDSLKLKRKEVEKFYKKDIEQLYS